MLQMENFLEEGPFENIWIQPAAGDAGGALGAALNWMVLVISEIQELLMIKLIHKKDLILVLILQMMKSIHSLKSIIILLRNIVDDELIKTVAELIAEEKVIGWFDGRMEFGPRALGCTINYR